VVRNALLLFLLAALGTAAFPAAEDLDFQPIITKTTYCSERGGLLTLRLALELRSQTATTVPYIFSQFALASGYELFRDETAVRLNKRELRSKVRLKEVLDAQKLNPVAPDPKLFRIVPAGEIAKWYTQVEIPVLSNNGDARSLLGTDRYLRVRLNPWPAARKPGERLRKAWHSQGELWLTEFVSLPVKIHIEKAPKPIRCWMQID
jgi:hypothetical protein